MRLLRLALTVAACLVVGWPVAAADPTSQQGLAEAARQARQQKRQAPKAAHVYTNDNIPSGPGGAVRLGAGVPPSAGATEPAGAAESAAEQGASKEGEKERADLEGDITTTKEKLAVLKKDLELLSREYDLQRQQFFSSPAYSSDTAGRARYDALGNQVNAKRQEVQETEQKLAALEDKLKELGPAKEKSKSKPSEDAAYWQGKLQPLRDELSRVEAQIAQMRAATTGALPPYQSGEWGGFTGNSIEQLERKRSELQRQIADIEEEARRAGVSPAWVR